MRTALCVQLGDTDVSGSFQHQSKIAGEYHERVAESN